MQFFMTSFKEKSVTPKYQDKYQMWYHTFNTKPYLHYEPHECNNHKYSKPFKLKQPEIRWSVNISYAEF